MGGKSSKVGKIDAALLQRVRAMKDAKAGSPSKGIPAPQRRKSSVVSSSKAKKTKGEPLL